MHLLLESTFVKSLLQENLFVHMVSHASVGGDDKVTPSDVSDSVLIIMQRSIVKARLSTAEPRRERQASCSLWGRGWGGAEFF